MSLYARLHAAVIFSRVARVLISDHSIARFVAWLGVLLSMDYLVRQLV